MPGCPFRNCGREAALSEDEHAGERAACGRCAVEATLPKGIAEMCPRIENAAVRARLVPRAKLICWSGVLSAACLAYAAWAGPPTERSSNSTPRLDQRTTVQLGFVADDDPVSEPQPVPQRVLPNAPLSDFSAPAISAPITPGLPPVPLRQFGPMPRPQQTVADEDESRPQDLAGSWWSVFVIASLRENCQPVPLSIEEISAATLLIPRLSVCAFLSVFLIVCLCFCLVVCQCGCLSVLIGFERCLRQNSSKQAD